MRSVPTSTLAEQQNFYRNTQPAQLGQYPIKTFRDLDVQIVYGQYIRSIHAGPIDYQGINWSPQFLQITRAMYRQSRYTSYITESNYQVPQVQLPKKTLVQPEEQFFEVDKYYKGLKPRNSHVQLRNCVQATSSHDFYYLSEDLLKHCCSVREQVNYLGVPQNTLTPNKQNFRSCSFSVDQNSFVLGGFSGGLYFQNIATGRSNYLQNITEGDTPQYGGDVINFVKIYRDGLSTNVIAAANDKYVSIFDMESPFIAKDRYLCSAEVNIAKLNPQQSSVMGVFCDKTDAEIMDLRSNSIVSTLKGHTDFGLALDWHPNGQQLATGNQDRTTRIWDMRNLNSAVHVLPAEIGNPYNVKYSDSGEFLTFIECSDFLHIYDTTGDYNKYQLIDFFGSTTGLDVRGDQIFVGVNMNQYDGIMELKRINKQSSYQLEFEDLSF